MWVLAWTVAIILIKALSAISFLSIQGRDCPATLDGAASTPSA
jgi:hypothetical protein